MELAYALKLDSAIEHPEYRHQHFKVWPPAPDWVVIRGDEGKPISYWKDREWNLTRWAGSSLFILLHESGRGGQKVQFGPENEDVARNVAGWLLYGPDASRAVNTFSKMFLRVKRIIALCETERISARDLSKFPAVIRKIAGMFRSEMDRASVRVCLDRLLRYRETLGFAILDEGGMRVLARCFQDVPVIEETEQTAYMPPRIWKYQMLRLRECIDEFLQHRAAVVGCFEFVLGAYVHNAGSLEKLMAVPMRRFRFQPFGNLSKRSEGTYKKNGKVNYGDFSDTARRFGIDELLRKWVGSESGALTVRQLSKYLNLVVFASMAYIINLTLQRKEEARTLRADCLLWEEVPLVGKVAIIRGETTKTDPDSDARWPASRSAEVAVEAANCIARIRMVCAVANPKVKVSAYDRENPVLFHRAFEPWSSSKAKGSYSSMSAISTYSTSAAQYSGLFDEAELRMTEDDLNMAKMFTPNLKKKGAFVEGALWPLGFHQCRRTSGVNMFASGLLSDSSMQVILKHLTVFQSQYYGANYSRLKFSEEFEYAVVNSKYEVLAKQLEALSSTRYVSPWGEGRKFEIIANLVPEKTFKNLVAAGMRGDIQFRPTLLGGCAKDGHCEYGGIESISRCSGGDGAKPCNEAIYDRMNRSSVERLLSQAEADLAHVQKGSPRAKALQEEINGLRNYLNATAA